MRRARNEPDPDPEDGLAELADLWRAETPEDLHRVLVLRPPVRRSADTFEPFGLLAKHHETEPDGSVVTAMLLLTDRRWGKGASQLVRRIEAADLVAVEELDLLAEVFVRANDAVYWEVPDDWFSEDFVIGLEPDVRAPDGDDEHDDAVEVPDGPAVARRDVFPPLRRWASSRLTRRDATAWGGLLARARDLGGRRGAPLVSGLLDAIDVLPPAAQDVLVETAVGWPDQAVRLLGFDQLAQRKGPPAAHDRAMGDPSARVRSWADSILDAGHPPPEADGKAAGTGRDDGQTGGGSPGEQPSLF